MIPIIAESNESAVPVEEWVTIDNLEGEGVYELRFGSVDPQRLAIAIADDDGDFSSLLIWDGKELSADQLEAWGEFEFRLTDKKVVFGLQ